MYSDSESAISILSHGTDEHLIALNILRLYHQLTQPGPNIYICWLPGHVEITDDELADTAAKSVDSRCQMTLPFKDVKGLVKLQLFTNWQSE